MKLAYVFALALGISLVSNINEVQAQACGGVVVQQNDCGGNDRGWHYSCCPDGYRVQGVAYTDIRKQDHVDAISAVCRSISKGNDVMASDFSRTPKTFVCDKTEVLAGVVSKDVRTEGGGKRDTLDGLSAVCQTPSSKNLRTISNHDIDSTERNERRSTVYLPKRVVGLAYKEKDNGGSNPGKSDRADCVTIITK
jgi:hypothetical protein